MALSDIQTSLERKQFESPIKAFWLAGHGYMWGAGAVPSDGETEWGYGAEFINTSASGVDDMKYVNYGDKDSCNFDALDRTKA